MIATNLLIGVSSRKTWLITSLLRCAQNEIPFIFRALTIKS